VAVPLNATRPLTSPRHKRGLGVSPRFQQFNYRATFDISFVLANKYEIL
jgi:hypothetical protein